MKILNKHTMKPTLSVLVLLLISVTFYGQDFENGTIITKHYDTITNVQIEKYSDSKSLLQITYVDKEGKEQSPSMETIKCYTRGDEKFIRIYYDCDMILVKVVEQGPKVNLYERILNGVTYYYIEKVYDELIKVPNSSSKFAKEISDFLSTNETISNEVKDKKLTDVVEIVSLYNKG
jgi:hypothetical protein